MLSFHRAFVMKAVYWDFQLLWCLKADLLLLVQMMQPFKESVRATAQNKRLLKAKNPAIIFYLKKCSIRKG